MNQLKRPPHAGMRHVALNVLNVSTVECFYVDLLSFNVEWRPDVDNVYLSSGIDNLAIHRVDDTGGKAQKLDHIGIIVDKADHVDQWYEFLTTHQVKSVCQPKTHRDGARSFYCFDPEKNVVQIIYHPPLSKG